MKTTLLIFGVIFCTASAVFNFYAATLIRHVQFWEIVQAGVLLVGICYTLAAIALLEVAGRRSRKAEG